MGLFWSTTIFEPGFWSFAYAVESELVPPTATLPLIPETFSIITACEKSLVNHVLTVIAVHMVPVADFI
jgi:hypothetical protein